MPKLIMWLGPGSDATNMQQDEMNSAPCAPLLVFPPKTVSCKVEVSALTLHSTDTKYCLFFLKGHVLSKS